MKQPSHVHSSGKAVFISPPARHGDTRFFDNVVLAFFGHCQAGDRDTNIRFGKPSAYRRAQTPSQHLDAGDLGYPARNDCAK